METTMMLVDCQTCPVRNVRCSDCMVTALSSTPSRSGIRSRGPGPLNLGDPARQPRTVPLDRAERRAVSTFLAAGLVTTSTANAARAEVDREAGVAEGPHVDRWAV